MRNVRFQNLCASASIKVSRKGWSGHVFQLVSVFHFALHYKVDSFRVKWAHSVFLGLFHDVVHYLILVDVDISLFIWLCVQTSAGCVIINNYIEELAEEYKDKVNIGKCDVDENSDLPARFGVRSIPTVVFIKNGEVVDKQVGATGKSALQAKVDALL